MFYCFLFLKPFFLCFCGPHSGQTLPTTHFPNYCRASHQRGVTISIPKFKGRILTTLDPGPTHIQTTRLRTQAWDAAISLDRLPGAHCYVCRWGNQQAWSRWLSDCVVGAHNWAGLINLLQPTSTVQDPNPRWLRPWLIK